MRAHKHQLEWRQARPLWSPSEGTRGLAPTLLGFADERFMDDLAADLARAPAAVGQREALRKETWRDALGTTIHPASERTAEPARLYQPVHGRYYLVAGSLVCRVAGAPDHTINRARKERASFVLRRLLPTAQGWDEYGWRSGGWVRLGNSLSPEARRPADDAAGTEERLSLFPQRFVVDGEKRTLHVGFIPVAAREAFQGASTSAVLSAPAGSGDELADVAVAELESRVQVALMQIGAQVAAGSNALDELREALFFAVIDLGEVVERFAPLLWAAIVAQRTVDAALDTRAQSLLTLLSSVTFSGSRTWAAALRDARAALAVVEARRGPTEVTWIFGLSAAQLGTAAASIDLTPVSSALAGRADPAPTRASLMALPKVDPGEGATYTIRLLYERPDCPDDRVVSAPSRTFTLAPHFDPDAPVRPLTISLPVDTSIAGLRRFPKAVSFLVSRQLREQMDRVKTQKLADLEDGNLGPASTLDVGMICSLSIPIITICAMILLMIIISILNIVFWWLPFFKICLPLRLGARTS